MALRRRKSSPNGGALTAAAKRVPLDSKPPDKPSLRECQKQAWAFYRDVPEVKELVLWRGNQIAKLRLFAATRPLEDPDGEPVPVTDEVAGIDPAVAAVAGEVVRALKSNFGGQPELLRRLEMNLEIPGELYLVGFGDRPPDRDKPGDLGTAAEWVVASMSEILWTPGPTSTHPGTWAIKANEKDKEGRKLDPDLGDDLFRIWMPDAEWQSQADNALMGALSVLGMIQVMNGQMLAESRSRIPAGILAVPNGLIVQQNLAAEANAQDGQENLGNKFIQDLVTAITTAVSDPSDVATLAPLIVRGEKDDLDEKVFRWIDISRVPDEHLDKRMNNMLSRVFRGLDAPVEVIEGHMQTTFSNATQVDSDTFDDYIEPRAVLVVDALSVGYFRPILAKTLAERGMVVPPDIDRMFMWFDPQDLVSQPNPAEAASDGHDRGALSDAAWRRHMGFDEGDAAEPLELLIRAAYKRGNIADNVTVALFRMLDESIELPDPKGNSSTGNPQDGNTMSARDILARALGIGDTPTVTETQPLLAVAHSVDRQRENVGRDMVEVDREFRNRVLIAADAMMGRALERAGNRLRSQTASGIREVVRNVAPHLRAQRVGPALLAEAGITPASLLDGAFDDLRDQYMAWGAQSQSQATELANRIVGGFSDAQRDHLGLRLAESLDESWTWMHGALSSLAEARLFDPTPAATIGEFDPTLRVPPGLVRQAAARAGGAAGLWTGGSGEAFVSLVDAGTRPAGGIATGEIIRGELRDKGVLVEAYEWDYGQAQRQTPFKPHRRLSGIRFSNFDSPVLSNGSGWPPFSFYLPGDHDGCRCDVIPILISPKEIPPG